MENQSVLYSHLVGKSRDEIVAIARSEIVKTLKGVDLQDYRDVRIWKTSKYFRVRFDSNVTIREQEVFTPQEEGRISAPSIGTAISFTASERTAEVRPRDIKHLFTYTDEIRGIAKTFNVRDSLSFKDRGDSFEVHVSHPSSATSSGGSEVYLINKRTKERDMIKHSHPRDFGKMGKITGPDGQPYVDPDPEIEMPDPAFPAHPEDRGDLE